MLSMNQGMLAEEAEIARQKALSYLGTPEGSLLLKIARGFDDLALRAKKRRSEVPEERH